MSKQRAPRVSAETLSGIALFQNLEVEYRQRIADWMQGHAYKAGQLIIAHKDDSTDVFFIIAGSVRATVYSYTGRRVNFRDIGPGHAFGEWSAIDGEPRSSTVIALTDCVVCSMTRQRFKEVALSQPSIAWELLEQMAGLMRQLSDRVVELSTLGVKNRLHAELLRLATHEGAAAGEAIIPALPTNEEIANRISTRREAVNRELRRLESIGLLRRDGDARIITDREQLVAMVKEAVGE